MPLMPFMGLILMIITIRGYAQILTNEDSLKGTMFGLPWNIFWVYADDAQKAVLCKILSLIKSAGATIINEIENETIVSPTGWNWHYGITRGYLNESEYTVVKVDFYNRIRAYLSELEKTNIRTLEDIIQYNYDNDGSEGGNPWPLEISAFTPVKMDSWLL